MLSVYWCMVAMLLLCAPLGCMVFDVRRDAAARDWLIATLAGGLAITLRVALEPAFSVSMFAGINILLLLHAIFFRQAVRRLCDQPPDRPWVPGVAMLVTLLFVLLVPESNGVQGQVFLGGVQAAINGWMLLSFRSLQVNARAMPLRSPLCGLTAALVLCTVLRVVLAVRDDVQSISTASPLYQGLLLVIVSLLMLRTLMFFGLHIAVGEARLNALHLFNACLRDRLDHDDQVLAGLDGSSRLAAPRAGAMAAAMVHELSQPLTGLALDGEYALALIETAVQPDALPRVRQHLGLLVDQVHAMTDLVRILRDHLAVARQSVVPHAHAAQTSLQPFPMAEELASIVQLARLGAEGRGLSVRLDMDQGLVAAVACPVQVRQVLHGLCNTAILRSAAFGAANPVGQQRVLLVCTRHKQCVQLEILFCGRAFDSGLQDMLGAAAQRTQLPEDDLSLWLDARVVRLNGGTLRAISRTGHEQCLSIRFPLATGPG